MIVNKYFFLPFNYLLSWYNTGLIKLLLHVYNILYDVNYLKYMFKKNSNKNINYYWISC